jgi:23S rRNA pseudouridine955/2504/2580 synthase
MVVNKPAGLAVHGGSGVTVGLIEALRGLRPETPDLELAHRLDRDTSGCLLLAKNRPVMLALHRMLRNGEMEKDYVALVAGAWRGGAREVSAALEQNRQRFGSATLMEIQLLTGRTHQARVHAAHLGHPIAGDDKYGDREFNRRLHQLGLRRLFLHAQRLRFTHPLTGYTMDIEAPLPDELSILLQRLSREAKT